jgi:hypothetical protein
MATFIEGNNKYHDLYFLFTLIGPLGLEIDSMHSMTKKEGAFRPPATIRV